MRSKVVALAALLAVAVAALGVAAEPAQTQVCGGLRATAIHFRASDGVRLNGAVLGKGRVGVALAHEYYANLCNWAPYARYLAARGFRVLLFDTRCFGQSGCRREKNVDADVAGAATELRRRGAKQVVLAGASLGASASLVAAARLKRAPAAVISLSSPSTNSLTRLLGNRFALDPDTAVQRLKTPTLFLAASADNPFQDDAKKLYGLSNARAKQFEIVAGSAHGTALLDPVVNPSAAHVRTLIVTFIRAHT
jgi:pimeloyl-ACP methyl ester carboxylesterase